jgi:hypothetical protein
MRKELPHLVIEVCASGGHRLEPSMLALASMGSFSDAHESPEIPIIAANLHRLILPRQSQIWAVLHAADSTQRLVYSLSAGFLGRLCLSGEIDHLSETQWTLVKNAINFYEKVAPLSGTEKAVCISRSANPGGTHRVHRRFLAWQMTVNRHWWSCIPSPPHSRPNLTSHCLKVIGPSRVRSLKNLCRQILTITVYGLNHPLSLKAMYLF